MKKIISILALCAAVLVSSCTKNTDSVSIIGQWSCVYIDEGDGDPLILTSESKYYYVIQYNPNGTYKSTQNFGPGCQCNGTWSLTGKELTMTNWEYDTDVINISKLTSNRLEFSFSYDSSIVVMKFNKRSE